MFLWANDKCQLEQWLKASLLSRKCWCKFSKSFSVHHDWLSIDESHLLLKSGIAVLRANQLILLDNAVGCLIFTQLSTLHIPLVGKNCLQSVTSHHLQCLILLFLNFGRFQRHLGLGGWVGWQQMVTHSRTRCLSVQKPTEQSIFIFKQGQHWLKIR